MPDDDTLPDDLAQAYAYALTVGVIRKGWKFIYDEDLKPDGESSRAQFGSCIVHLKERVRTAEEIKKWGGYFGKEDEKDIVKIITPLPVPADKSTITSVDDIAFSRFRAAAVRVAVKHGEPGKKVVLELPVFLRECLDRVFAEGQLKGRLNVGPNQHFPRLAQWIQEISDLFDNQGIRLRNAGGRGAVAAFPTDPKKLTIVIKADYLPKPDRYM